MTAGTLVAEQVGMQFEGLSALSDVSLEVPAGQIHGLIGPNGAGKTTFFNCLSGFYRPTSGQIQFDGHRIDGLAPHEISRAGVARTFQNIRLFAAMTAIENVLVGSHAHDGPAKAAVPDRISGPRLVRAARGIPGAPVAAARAIAEIGGAVVRPPQVKSAERTAIRRAREVLQAVGLAGKENVVARNLSYGDQRRLELARALASRPKLLLLDEPTAGMNPQESAATVGLIRWIRNEFSTTVILIEHQMRVVMGVCEQITVLDYGKKIAEGTPEQIQRDTRVIEAYLGTRAVEGGGHAAP